MSNLMARGMSYIGVALATAASTSITYTVKATATTGTITDSIPASEQIATDTSVGSHQSRHEANTRHRVIPVASLLSACGVSVPAIGDEWTETINGVSTTYEIKPATGEAAFHYSDTGRTRVRVKGKKVIT
jgi:hypothetical protein